MQAFHKESIWLVTVIPWSPMWRSRRAMKNHSKTHQLMDSLFNFFHLRSKHESVEILCRHIVVRESTAPVLSSRGRDIRRCSGGCLKLARIRSHWCTAGRTSHGGHVQLTRVQVHCVAWVYIHHRVRVRHLWQSRQINEHSLTSTGRTLRSVATATRDPLRAIRSPDRIRSTVGYVVGAMRSLQRAFGHLWVHLRQRWGGRPRQEMLASNWRRFRYNGRIYTIQSNRRSWTVRQSATKVWLKALIDERIQNSCRYGSSS